MKNALTFALLFLPLVMFAQDKPILPEKVLFLGNSITYAGDYVAQAEAYLRVKNPDRKLEFINIGLPSETLSGLSEPGHAGGAFPRPDLHERLHRVLEAIQPRLIIACYGMNDGIYLPFDEQRFGKFKEGVDWLDSTVKSSGAEIIWLTPPLFDERKGAAYANVLDIYSDWLLSKQYTENWAVVDLHWPMKKYLEDRRAADSTFAFATDGVHPNELGHWIMARELLAFLGEREVFQAKEPAEAFSSFRHGEQILKLVKERQSIMKDAWLTKTGHQRPGMKTGLPLDEAIKQAGLAEKEINTLLTNSK